MKVPIVSDVYYYRYPQYIWARAVNDVLKSGVIKNPDSRSIIDAPCGDGIVSYWLGKRGFAPRLKLYDISADKIHIAQKHISAAEIREKDIFNLDIDANDNIWLLINSLYCLNGKEELFARLGPKMAYIVGIFPYTEHRNYKAFMANNPGFRNPAAMTKDDTIKFFLSRGYGILTTKDLTPVPYHEKTVFMPMKLKTRILNMVDGLVKTPGAYWLGVFERR